MDESFENNSLDNLVIKDKSYRNKIKKKKNKNIFNYICNINNNNCNNSHCL